MLIRYLVRKELGDAMIVRINPQTVKYRKRGNQPLTNETKLFLKSWESRLTPVQPILRFLQKALYSVEPFAVSPDFFSSGVFDIEQDWRYRLIKDLVAKRSSVEDTLWHAHLAKMLENNGVAKHKELRFTNREEIAEFLETYALGLINSLESSGYDENNNADIGTAFIDQNGKIVKSEGGNHRFIAARILGVSQIPIEILGIHRGFLQQNTGRSGTKDICALIRSVETLHKLPT